jgi:phage antirepressor YoqD-like protein
LKNCYIRIGKLFEGNLKKISVPRISNWLLDNGYLIRVSDGNGISHREASEKGKDIGLINVQIELDENRSYIQYMFTPEAQKYIFKNLAEIGTYKR